METMTAPLTLEFDSFFALTLGIVVYFIGARLTKRFKLLAAYSIPEPVSGGLFVAGITLLVFLFAGREVVFDLAARDALLVYFFTTVGLNARFADLLRGGPILGVLLGLTVGFMVIQNIVGVLGALLFGLPAQTGILLGTASLIGGHGTAIAWGPTIETDYGVAGAAELGIAAATVGLILASLLGGPIAKYLIEGKNLQPDDVDPAHAARHADQVDVGPAGVTNVNFMRSIFWVHIAIILGAGAHESLSAAGVKLPLFVPCLLMGIVLSNTLPYIFRHMTWPAGTPAMTLISEFSLSVFLSMSLMSMQLWTLASSAGVLTFTMVLQAVVAAFFIIFVVFRFMGRNYFAGVLSAGFAGFTLGATPTAIANMTAVTQRYGPAPLAFIVLPLVSAFFVDLANAFIIKWFLTITG